MRQYIINKTKHLFAFVVYTLLPLIGGGWVGVSCSDMLETDSSRQLFEPELNHKTDTIFYALGILQGMQQLADQYVFQGEMRGDLVQTTTYTDNNLRQLADFSATTQNRYDSAFVYYRVINNCNYYIAHVDTTLRTGADYVMMNEYVAVKSIRAWAYMQLARVYGKVPFYTEPLTQISQIDNNNYPELDLNGIVSALAPDLEYYTKDKVYGVPNYGSTPSYANFNPSYIFFPADVVLGDMYLETGNYSQAASHYIRYFTKVAATTHAAYTQPYVSSSRSAYMDELPSDWDNSNFTGFGAGTWSDIFKRTENDYITYIPMPTSSLQGATTILPLTYGYDLYATDKSGESRYVDEVQLVASDSYLSLTNSQDYYYVSNASTTSNVVVNKAQLGDMRYRSIIHERENAETDSTQVWITKFNNASIPLYRTSTVWMHLAEAFNRLGMPDAAFAILKDGIHEGLVNAIYMTPATLEALTTTYPLLSDENKSKFTDPTNWMGIHMHGSGMAADIYRMSNAIYYRPGLSPYTMDNIVGKKLSQIASDFNVSVGATKQDSINAVEDLLCDEYALEFAFEGTRFYDLCRLARHKNAAGLYGANFGSLWLARKLAYKQPTKDLTIEQNWYLPFK